MRSDARARIFAALRGASPGEAPAIVRAARPVEPAGGGEADRLDRLDRQVAAAGGRLVRADSVAAVAAVLPGLEDAAHVWSALPTVASRGVARTAEDAAALADLDFTLLPGRLAVAENGAVWNVPRSPLERAAALLAEHLVLVVPSTAVVDTLHAAYASIEPEAAPFGWFLSGPSKTADIEQALVLGAHGPRSATWILVDG